MNILISIFVISIPSVPSFFLFIALSKLCSKKKDSHTINPSLLNYMMCFGFGTLLGDVLLHIIPHMIEGKLDKIILY